MTASQEAAAAPIAKSVELLAIAKAARSKAPEAIKIAVTAICQVASIAAAEAECQGRPELADKFLKCIDDLYAAGRNTATLADRKHALALAVAIFDGACSILAN